MLCNAKVNLIRIPELLFTSTLRFKHWESQPYKWDESATVSDRERLGFITSHYAQSAVDVAASKQEVRLTPESLMYTGKKLDDGQILRSARFIHRELPVRIAHRIMGFRELPFIIGCNPTILTVIENLQEEEEYSRMVKKILEDHTVVLGMLAGGFKECRARIKDADLIRKFLDTTLTSRLGLRILAEHHLALRENKQSSPYITYIKVKVAARLESYSCKMVSEEKKQFKELVSRLKGTDKQESQAQRLGSSQTLRNLWEMTGQSVDPSTYQMSTVQDQSSPSNKLSSGTTLSTGKKRTRSDTTSSSEDGTAPSSPMTHKSTASTLSPKDLFCLMGTLNSCFGPAYDFMSARSDEFCLEPELWLIKHYISRFCSIYADKYEALAPRLWKSIDDEITPSQCVVYSYRPDHLSDPYSTGCLASFNYFFYNKSLKRVLFFSFRVLNDPVVTDIDDEEGTQDLF